MTTIVLTIGPRHTLRDASRQMSVRRVGAAVVHNPETSGIGIITERDILDSLATDGDPDVEVVEDHLTSNVVFAASTWTLERAAAAMVRGGFRHLIVVDSGDVVGMISVRDIVRCWSRVFEPA